MNYRQFFHNICKEGRKLKPLCSTRFLCRLWAIVTVFDQYKQVLSKSLKKSTYLGLTIAKIIISPLEEANKTLPSRSCNISDMITIVEIVKCRIQTTRKVEYFEQLIATTEVETERMQLKPL